MLRRGFIVNVLVCVCVSAQCIETAATSFNILFTSIRIRTLQLCVFFFSFTKHWPKLKGSLFFHDEPPWVLLVKSTSNPTEWYRGKPLCVFVLDLKQTTAKYWNMYFCHSTFGVYALFYHCMDLFLLFVLISFFLSCFQSYFVFLRSANV